MADTSLFNVGSFVATTAMYFFIRPALPLSSLANEEERAKATKRNYMLLAGYFLAILFSQFFINVWIVNAKCGGDNLFVAAAYTFLPWTLIFGVMIAVLLLYPSFKSAFSDVIGYYVVSSSANTILNQLLINKDAQQSIDQSPADPTQKMGLQNAADTIVKIMGNTSVLINQLTPENFAQYWEKVFKPLMKPGAYEDPTLKEELFKLVQRRDSVGEFMWYLYTGVLLTSIVQMKIVTRGCVASAETLKKNYQAFLEKEKEHIAEEEKNKSVEYVQNY